MTMQAVIRAKFEEESKAAAKPVTSWLARQKLLPSRRIPFRKTKAEEAKLAEMGLHLSRLLPAYGSLHISPTNAQRHFALSAKACATFPSSWCLKAPGTGQQLYAKVLLLQLMYRA